MIYPPSVRAESTELSAWIVYWDSENGEKELKKIDKKVQALSYFGAYFNKSNKLFIPKELLSRKKEHVAKRAKFTKYLTVINDKELSKGKVILKDIELLKELFKSDERMEKHVTELISLAKKHGFDGIEVDYERIWVDPQVGADFSRFINKLAYQAVRNNLKLRVVLEPGVPFDKTNFARGPEYVIMMYNLYGTHSGPGPKADRDFIARTIKKMEHLPNKKAVAFSNGGCMWGTDGSKKFITQEEAEALIEKYKPEVQVDTVSAAKYFQYNAENGYLYTVWYADSATMNYWIDTARMNGVNNVSLWRLGGNVKIEDVKVYEKDTP